MYNRPEANSLFWTAERKAKFPNGLPRLPQPEAIGPPVGWDVVPFAADKPDLHPSGEPIAARVVHNVMEFGRLEQTGEFTPDYRLPVVKWQPELALKATERLTGYIQPYTLPLGGQKQEGVYELRSGRLIRGILDNNGVFTPILGSTVKAFKDFDPADKREARIYNLPGVLRRQKPK
jgi:hypothetical protein